MEEIWAIFIKIIYRMDIVTELLQIFIFVKDLLLYLTDEG